MNDKAPEKQNHAEKHSSLITWGIASSIFVVLGIYIIAQVIALFLVNIYPTLRHWNSAQSGQWINNSVIGQFWFVVIVEALSLFFLHLFLKRRRSNFKSIGLKKRPKLSDIPYALIGFVAYILIYAVILALVTKAIPQFNAAQKQEVAFSSAPTVGADLWLAFIGLVILPPIVEEILFRGFMYTGLRSKLPKMYAAVITGLIFASLHLLEGKNGVLWVAGLDTFVLSMVLVYLREKTDSLYASMAVHMLKNFLAFGVLFLPTYFHFI